MVMMYILIFLSLFSVHLSSAALSNQIACNAPIQIIYDVKTECIRLQKTHLGNGVTYQWVIPADSDGNVWNIYQAVHGLCPVITSTEFFLSVLMQRLRDEDDNRATDFLSELNAVSEKEIQNSLSSIVLQQNKKNLFNSRSVIDDYRIYAVTPDLSELQSRYSLQELSTMQTIFLAPPSATNQCPDDYGFDLANLPQNSPSLFMQGQTVGSYIRELKRSRIAQRDLINFFANNSLNVTAKSYAFIKAMRFLRPRHIADHTYVVLGFGHGSRAEPFDVNEQQAMAALPSLLQEYRASSPDSHNGTTKTIMGMPQGAFSKLLQELDQWGIALLYVTTCCLFELRTQNIITGSLPPQEDENSIIDVDPYKGYPNSERLSYALAFAGTPESSLKISHAKRTNLFMLQNHTLRNVGDMVVHILLAEKALTSALVKHAKSQVWQLYSTDADRNQEIRVLGNVNQTTAQKPLKLPKNASVMLGTKAILQPLELYDGSLINLGATGEQIYHLRSINLCFPDAKPSNSSVAVSPADGYFPMAVEHLLFKLGKHFAKDFVPINQMACSEKPLLLHIDQLMDERTQIVLHNVLVRIVFSTENTTEIERTAIAQHEYNGIMNVYGFSGGRGAEMMPVDVDPYEVLHYSAGAAAVSELNRVRVLANRREQLRNKLDLILQKSFE